MPSLPTSLSVVALALAWLVVLVPMAARRREHVPESDDRSAGFRVLRRTSRRRNQRVLSRTAVASASADPGADERNGGVDGMGDPTLWSDEDEDELERDRPEVDDRMLDVGDIDDEVDEEVDEFDEFDEFDDDSESDEGEDGEESVQSGADLAESLYDTDDDLDDFDDDEELPAAAAVAPVAGRVRPDVVAVAAQGRPSEWDAADEWTAEHPAARARRTAMEEPPAARVGAEPESDSGASGDPGRAPTRGNDRYLEPRYDEARNDHGRDEDNRDDGAEDHEIRHDDARYDDAAADQSLRDPDPTSMRPVPRRRGRGGFDPDMAARARAFRYRRRRRVTVVLLLALVAFTLVSVFVAPTAWIGAVLSGALLIGYLAYLRRQVRIEESIRQRRTARLAQARQIRPEYARAGARESSEHRGAGYAPSPAGYDDHRSTRLDPGAPTTPAPPYRAGTVVDLEDDDPAFSDLDYHQPLAYRRASGQ